MQPISSNKSLKWAQDEIHGNTGASLEVFSQLSYSKAGSDKLSIFKGLESFNAAFTLFCLLMNESLLFVTV